MRKKATHVTLSVYPEQHEWFSHCHTSSRYIAQTVEWRIARFRGACAFLHIVDKRLVERAIKALHGMDWGWYPDPEAIAARLEVAEDDDDWMEFVQAVRTMPRVAYALEAVAREVWSPNTQASKFL